MTNATKKIISLVVLLCFAMTQTVTANPGAGIEIAPKYETPAFLQIDIPAELATLDGLFEAAPQPDPRMILHIQNAHANFGAQEKIKALLQYLKKSYAINTVFVEGASEDLNPEYLKMFPDRERNLKLADFLAKKGELTGVEMFMIDEAEQGPGTQDSSLGKTEDKKESRGESRVRGVGIENVDLYRRNYDALKKVFGAEKTVNSYLGGFETRLDGLASKVFSPDLRKLLGEWKKFEKGNREFMPYVRALGAESKRILGVDLDSLMAQVEWPQITRLLVLQSLEKELNEEKSLAEKGDLVRFLKEKHASVKLIEAVENFQDQRVNVLLAESEQKAGPVQPRNLMEQLVTEAGSQGFYFDNYPNFSRYAGYLILKSELDPKGLFTEIQTLFASILDELAKTPRQKTLLELFRDEELVRKLLNLELTRKNWQEALQRGGLLSMDSMVTRLKDIGTAVAKESSLPLTNFETKQVNPKFRAEVIDVQTAAYDFYEAARKREDAFYQKIDTVMREGALSKAVLITGGFHTDGITELLREHQVSYGILTPRLSEKSDEHLYRSVMLQNKASNFELSYLEAVSRLQRFIAQGGQVGEDDVINSLRPILLAIGYAGDLGSVVDAINIFNQSVYAKDAKIRIDPNALKNKQGEEVKKKGKPVYEVIRTEARNISGLEETASLGARAAVMPAIPPETGSLGGHEIGTNPVAATATERQEARRTDSTEQQAASNVPEVLFEGQCPSDATYRLMSSDLDFQDRLDGAAWSRLPDDAAVDGIVREVQKRLTGADEAAVRSRVMGWTLQTMLVELYKNADDAYKRAGKKGSIYLKVSRQGGRVFFDVSDDGIGFGSWADGQGNFNPQAKPSLAGSNVKLAGGQHVGLLVSRMLVQALGGNIVNSQNKEHLTTVRIELPEDALDRTLAEEKIPTQVDLAQITPTRKIIAHMIRHGQSPKIVERLVALGVGEHRREILTILDFLRATPEGLSVVRDYMTALLEVPRMDPDALVTGLGVMRDQNDEAFVLRVMQSIPFDFFHNNFCNWEKDPGAGKTSIFMAFFTPGYLTWLQSRSASDHNRAVIMKDEWDKHKFSTFPLIREKYEARLAAEEVKADVRPAQFAATVAVAIPAAPTETGSLGGRERPEARRTESREGILSEGVLPEKWSSLTQHDLGVQAENMFLSVPAARTALTEMVRRIPDGNRTGQEFFISIPPIQNDEGLMRIIMASGERYEAGSVYMDGVVAHTHPITRTYPKDRYGRRNGVGARSIIETLVPSFEGGDILLPGAIVAGTEVTGYFVLFYDLSGAENIAWYRAMHEKKTSRYERLKAIVNEGKGKLYRLTPQGESIDMRSITFAEADEMWEAVRGDKEKTEALLTELNLRPHPGHPAYPFVHEFEGHGPQVMAFVTGFPAIQP